MPKVKFVNEQITVEARSGETLLAVCERSGINVFRGLFQDLHCGRVKGWCNRCKVWALPLEPNAVSSRTAAELRRFRLNGAIPAHGTMRLACQVIVQGDIEVRTRAGFEIPPNPDWQPDPRPFKWKQRWEQRNDAADDEDEPKKKPAAKAAKPATPAGSEAASAPVEGQPAASPAAADG